MDCAGNGALGKQSANAAVSAANGRGNECFMTMFPHQVGRCAARKYDTRLLLQVREQTQRRLFDEVEYVLEPVAPP